MAANWIPPSLRMNETVGTGYDGARENGIDAEIFQSRKIALATNEPSKYAEARLSGLEALKVQAKALHDQKVAYFLGIGQSRGEAEANAQRFTNAVMSTEMALFKQQWPQKISDLSTAATFARNNKVGPEIEMPSALRAAGAKRRARK